MDSGQWTIEAVLRWAADDFRLRGIESPRLDAELLLAHALATTRIQLVVDAKRTLNAEELGRLRLLVKRRRLREPIAYIVGEREFYGRPFRVDRRVLVPRPDTEALVDVGLRRTEVVSMCMRALDLCAGSGCVAITLARERPTSFVFATDVSEGALAVARENALRLGAYNVAFRDGDLFAAIGETCRFDLVTANPPYVPSSQIASLAPDIRDFEPRVALEGGEDGLAVLRRIVAKAPAHLTPQGGVLAVEVGAGEAATVVGLFEQSGFGGIEVKRDYGGIERVVSGVLSAIVLLAVLSSCAAACVRGKPGLAADNGAAVIRTTPNLAAARKLDREGVRSFRDERYEDAIRYFRAAYQLGGPSSELWNVARARERLDDPEGAASAIEEYLAQRDLTPQDRVEAEREARSLRARPSVLTVTTNPAGAVVTIDGKQTAGPTPLSIEILAGLHTIAVHREGYAVETRPLEARFGRAVIVSLDLKRSTK